MRIRKFLGTLWIFLCVYVCMCLGRTVVLYGPVDKRQFFHFCLKSLALHMLFIFIVEGVFVNILKINAIMLICRLYPKNIIR
uniref:Uncharacterized protein n=1 Tax=Anopheles darlingi TaxID=43151 RepID=A0A2M4DS37_ANODA